MSKIRVNKNSGNLNFSARNSDYHQKFSHLYQRKLANEKASSNPCTERFFKKEIEIGKETVKENVKPISREAENVKPLTSLEAGPDIELICENKFTERLSMIEDRLSVFYSRRVQ